MSETPTAAARGLGPRIALVRGRYDPFGGAERFVQNAVEALRTQGAALTLVTRSWPDHDGSALQVDPFYIGSLWRDWGFERAVCAELSRRHFDLVQSHERIACCDVYRAGDGVHAEWLAQRSRVQSAVAQAITRASPHHRFLLDAERRLFTSPRLRSVICNSAMVREEIASRFGVERSKLTLIRNAVDGSRFHPGLRAEFRDAVRQQLKIPGNANVVVYVGSGFERKGVGVLLEAAARVKPGPWVVVVGRDKRASRYMALARQRGIEERVRFVGAVSDVRPYHAASDVFALATLYDPQPNAALEAMASALPVITTRKCGVAELIDEGRTGFVRDALDATGMGQAIASLDSGAARTVGLAGREAVAPYTPEAMAREYLDLYRRLLPR